ncbi:DUF4870 domain-containing protein [Cytobacillus purgationiresistens]|uniref:Membrane protein (GlpM family) n=1 Tax=Cytobacillus purgationiresistens TaxID=863449 RepID=A0ABU0ACS9_9BACI|nr:DUF4870 domain-containing protein [Cytobacillus purgationiresistens]MDQ0269053.1 putative membrane protein (GlpM family) [Cytobacillus purgationiresistens]
MDTNKILSALSYFSILFAGVIFPIIVYFVVEDQKTKEHAKKALISHLITFIPLIIVIAGAFTWINNVEQIPILFITGGVLSIIISLAVLIWNMIKGIKVISTN